MTQNKMLVTLRKEKTRSYFLSLEQDPLSLISFFKSIKTYVICTNAQINCVILNKMIIYVK